MRVGAMPQATLGATPAGTRGFEEGVTVALGRGGTEAPRPAVRCTGIVSCEHAPCPRRRLLWCNKIPDATTATGLKVLFINDSID